MSEKKTIFILSRERIYDFFKALVTELAKNYHVVIISLDKWEDMDNNNIEVVDFYKLCESSVREAGSNIKSMASQIEEKIGISTYKTVSCLLLIYKFCRIMSQKVSKADQEHYESDEYITREYVGSYIALADLFERYRPSAVLYECIDFIPAYITFVLARQYGVFAFSFDLSIINNTKLSLGFGIYKKNIMLEYLYANRKYIKEESYKEGEEYLSRLTGKYETPHLDKIRKRVAENPYFSIRTLRLLLRGKYFTQPYINFQRYMNRIWMDKNFIKTIPDEPYIVFFMHYQPETSTTSAAPRWANQDAIIEQLAINAPAGLKILVKEHPTSYGSRGKNYFGQLKKLPNVILCHPIVNARELMLKAEAIMTINGTVGFEATLMGKKVGVLGWPSYSIYEGVKKLDYPEEIFAAIKDKSWKPEEMVQERRDFIAAYIQSQYECGVRVCDYWKWPDELNVQCIGSGGIGCAHALIDMLQFIDTHNLKPTDFEAGI